MDGGNVKRIVVPLEVTDKAAPELNLVMLAGSKARAHRQKDGSLILTPDTITNFAYEIPTLNPSFVTKKYRYFYGSCGNMTGTTGKVGKIDLETRETKDWFEDDLYTSVAYFVPRPGATAEDDGVVLVTLLHGAHKNKVTLLVLNARDMSEAARVTFTTPSDVPRSLHGIYIPA
nr:carotenoid isomerooxygenase-like [Cherax quadricarinatus]